MTFAISHRVLLGNCRDFNTICVGVSHFCGLRNSLDPEFRSFGVESFGFRAWFLCS